jgi:hypothetical protein
VIRHVVIMDERFPLSLRNVEDVWSRNIIGIK